MIRRNPSRRVERLKRTPNLLPVLTITLLGIFGVYWGATIVSDPEGHMEALEQRMKRRRRKPRIENFITGIIGPTVKGLLYAGIGIGATAGAWRVYWRRRAAAAARNDDRLETSRDAREEET